MRLLVTTLFLCQSAFATPICDLLLQRVVGPAIFDIKKTTREFLPGEKSTRSSSSWEKNISAADVWESRDLLIAVHGSQMYVRFYDLNTRAVVAEHRIKFSGEKSEFPDQNWGGYEVHFNSRTNEVYAFGETKRAALYKLSYEDLLAGKPFRKVKNFRNDIPISKEVMKDIVFSEDGNRLLISQRFASDSMSYGVWDLAKNQWVQLYVYKNIGDVKTPFVDRITKHAIMSADGNFLMTRISLEDPVHAASFARKNFESYTPHNFDLKQELPKVIINLNTGESRPVKYPEGMTEKLNTNSSVGLSRDGKLLWFSAAGVRYASDVGTGEIVHQFEHQGAEKFNSLSEDETVAFFNVDGNTAMIARDITKPGNPIIPNFVIPGVFYLGQKFSPSGKYMKNLDHVFKLEER